MSGAISELERKVDLAQKISEHPWPAVAIAFGAGVALSASRADVKAAQATTQASKDTGSKLGGALDGVIAALIAGVTEAFHSRIDGAVNEVVASIRGNSPPGSGGQFDRPSEAPTRAD
jgi:hypothetical protein